MHSIEKPHIPYLILMQWLMLAGLIGFGVYMAWDNGLLPNMLENDNTRLSILILALFLVGCMHCGERSYFLSKQFIELFQFNDPDNPSIEHVVKAPVSDYLRKSSGRDEQDLTLLTEVLAERIRGQHQIGWFVTGALIKLGLLGTVIGFMLMLGSLDNIKSMDLEQVQTLMQTMTQGMKIALNTTLLGLTTSLLLGVQYLYLDRRADQLIAQAIQLSKQDTSPQTLLKSKTAAAAQD